MILEPATVEGLFGPDTLLAWCVVPYDGRRRTPAERAAMLRELGLRRFAWDWRPEHLAQFPDELDALAGNGIALEAVWFPALLDAGPGVDDAGAGLLRTLARRGLRGQLWLSTMFGGPDDPVDLTPAEHAALVRRHVAVLAPVADAAGEVGCTVGLYNHGGWFGEPENQLDVVHALADRGLSNVGLVYNQHHGRAHVDRFAALLEVMAPHLLSVNLNGMTADGDRRGHKLLPVGAGELDVALLGTLAASGWRGPVGLIGHTADDAADRLRDNLEGLAWVRARLRGEDPPRPVPRIPHPVLPGW